MTGIIDVHARDKPRMLESGALFKKMEARGVSKVVLIPAMSEPLGEPPITLLAVARSLARRTLTRPLAEAFHRRTLTAEGNVIVMGQGYIEILGWVERMKITSAERERVLSGDALEMLDLT